MFLTVSSVWEPRLPTGTGPWTTSGHFRAGGWVWRDGILARYISQWFETSSFWSIIHTSLFVGGLFFRAFVEQYNDPPVHNLITFGSPHMGIADLPVCSPTDLMCQLARRAARVGVYSSWAQTNLVQVIYRISLPRSGVSFTHSSS